MHSPGVCGVILAAGSQAGADAAQWKSKAEGVTSLIDALNSDTEMVLVAVGTDAEALAPVIWGKAAYMVQLPVGVSDAQALRTMLQEVLNRGRDAVIVTSLHIAGLTAETVHRMVAAYCAAGDDVWAVVPETEMLQGHPVLMGRSMIELFLRGQQWNAVDEILSASREHVHTIKVTDPMAAVVTDTGWKAPWD
jgi:CTP:molybdopterin cytidylyltransferase MocA